MKKIISSLLAVVMTMSIASINAFAVTTATLSITNDVTTVKAGDVIEAVVIVDTTKGIANYTNTIKYDKDVFELVYSAAYDAFAADPENQALAEEVEMEMPDVYSEMTGYPAIMGDTMVDFWNANSTKALAGLSATTNSEGYPLFLCNGTSAVTALKAAKNAPVSAAMLKVKDGVAAGTTTISTTNVAVSDGTADTYYATTPITLTIEADAPSIVEKEVVVTPVKGNANAEGKFTQAFKASIKGNDETVTTVNFILSNGSKEWNSADNGKGWTGLNITGASPVTFGVNVLNVPSDATVTANFIAE